MIRIFYALATGLAKLLFLLLSRCQVTGKENVPRNGPLLIVSNHMSMVDPPLLAASIPRPIYFMAKRELFASWWSRLPVQAYGAFPVQRRGMNKTALSRAQKVLSGGHALGAFPEGRRSPHAQLQDADSGAALLALRTGVPVLPVGIAGTERLRTFRGWVSRTSLQVNIGQPFVLGPGNKKPGAEELAAATSRVMESIALLLPPSYQGPYGASAAPHPEAMKASGVTSNTLVLGKEP